ncbi:hypothetical protein KI387_000503, partial [Taxus chinensis]
NHLACENQKELGKFVEARHLFFDRNQKYHENNQVWNDEGSSASQVVQRLMLLSDQTDIAVDGVATEEVKEMLSSSRDSRSKWFQNGRFTLIGGYVTIGLQKVSVAPMTVAQV